MSNRTETPLLSIVIPVYNGSATLEPLLQALAQLHHRDKIEYLFVDDASTDGTATRILEAGYEPIRQPVRGGPAKARNAGVRQARAAWVLFLDADTAPPADLLARVESAMQQEDVVAVVGVYARTPINTGFWPRYKALQAWSYHALTEVQEINWIWGSMSCVRRAAFLDAGGFSEIYSGADLEDVELGRRLACRGRILLDRELIVGHHFPDTAWKNFRNHFHRGRLWCRLYVEDRRFDNYLTTRQQAVARVAIAVLPLAIIGAAILNGPAQTLAVFLTVTALLLYERSSGGFLQFCVRSAGLCFALRAAGAEMLLSWALIIAALVVAGESAADRLRHLEIAN